LPIKKKKRKGTGQMVTSVIAVGVSKSGSPVARPMIAWSVMAMVLEGHSTLACGLMDVSTASALTAAILDLLAPCLLSHDALQPRKQSKFDQRACTDKSKATEGLLL
jgi:hypothetical protein